MKSDLGLHGVASVWTVDGKLVDKLWWEFSLDDIGNKPADYREELKWKAHLVGGRKSVVREMTNFICVSTPGGCQNEILDVRVGADDPVII